MSGLGADSSTFDHSIEGQAKARITWADELGAEHLCVATEQSWACEQLAVIEREPGYRLLSCVVV